MKLKTIFLVVLILSALAVVACSPQEDANTDIQQELVAEDPQDIVGETAQDDLLTEDDFVEIGEMI